MPRKGLDGGSSIATTVGAVSGFALIATPMADTMINLTSTMILESTEAVSPGATESVSLVAHTTRWAIWLDESGIISLEDLGILVHAPHEHPVFVGVGETSGGPGDAVAIAVSEPTVRDDLGTAATPCLVVLVKTPENSVMRVMARTLSSDQYWEFQMNGTTIYGAMLDGGTVAEPQTVRLGGGGRLSAEMKLQSEASP